jgi:TolB protein
MTTTTRLPVTTARDDAGAAAGDSRIAFLRVTDGAWQPWSARPDGSDLKRLATLPADVTRLTLSADGALLLADCIDGGLHLVTTRDGADRRIEVDPSGPTDAALSGDGTRIAYSVNTLGGIDSNDLWIVPVAGGRGRKVTDQPYLQHFPSWGPDGALVYLSGRGGQAHDVWRVSASGGTPARIVGDRLYNFEPAVSPQGDIAFSSNRAGDYDIWLLRSGGGEPERVTHDPAYDGQPTFSPDGARIAFLSRRGGAARIWIHDLASGDERPLEVSGEVRMPFWSGTAQGRGAGTR